jgi:hypothetical protein
MRIYRIEKLYDKSGNHPYQQIRPVGDDVDWFNMWSFRCTPRSSVWPHGGARVKIANPKKPAGNFPFLEDGAIGMDRITRNRLAPTLPENVELLDVMTEAGRSYQLLNILDCADCVDEERSEWFSLPTRKHVGITRFAFRPERLPHSSLFKASAVPSFLFVSTGLVPPDRDFKLQYETLALRGLSFWGVWNDEGDPIPTVRWYGVDAS